MKLVILICFLLFVPPIASKASEQLKTDRWLEIDLCWFEQKNMEQSVNQFWERFYPLFQGIDGWRGIVLNVGWTSDYLFEWHGNLKETIQLPKNMKKYPWFKDQEKLKGNSIERMKQWKTRFNKADKPEIINFEPWSYADLKKLSILLKKTASKKFQLEDVMVGTFVVGFESIYDGEKTQFSKKHQNAYLNNAPNLVAKLEADATKYGAFPNGIQKGTTFTEFFGKQWGSLSKATDLDFIILRDSYMGVGIYGKRGPFGKSASPDPELVKNWSLATGDLVKQSKIANPKGLVIGYSNAASAVADWRVNCFDLETIAKEGYLDGWIDQTWAGAWNEVGQRPEGFWNNQLLGWTYQLSYLLGHAAILADTKVHHYFLIETFDAWESWDIIHNATERLRWGIWAFSHAAVKKQDGLKMPRGSYISWCNKGKNLLSETDVKFLSETSNAAFTDASKTKKIMGPTLVYCRSAMEWQSANKPSEAIGEWIDEQAGTLMKWSIPILSITRSEYLPRIESDMLIFQTPVHLKESEKANILKTLNSGNPSAVFASPAGGLDSDISSLLGISTSDKRSTETKYIGTTDYQTQGIFESIPNTFPLFQPYTKNKVAPGNQTIYSVFDSPCLTYNGVGGKNVIFWNAPEFSKNLPNDPGSYGKSLDQLLGSPIPFVLTARQINEMTKKEGFISVDQIEPYSPMPIAAWQKEDGSLMILAGNMEEGINHTANQSVQTIFNLPQINNQQKSPEVVEIWNSERPVIEHNKFTIHLNQAQTKLFRVK